MPSGWAWAPGALAESNRANEIQVEVEPSLNDLMILVFLKYDLGPFKFV